MTTPNPVQARVISRFPYLAEAGSTGAGGNSTAAGAAQALTDRAAVTGEAFRQRQVTDGFDAEALPPVTYDLNDDGWTGAAAEIHGGPVGTSFAGSLPGWVGSLSDSAAMAAYGQQVDAVHGEGNGVETADPSATPVVAWSGWTQPGYGEGLGGAVQLPEGARRGYDPTQGWGGGGPGPGGINMPVENYLTQVTGNWATEHLLGVREVPRLIAQSPESYIPSDQGAGGFGGNGAFMAGDTLVGPPSADAMTGVMPSAPETADAAGSVEGYAGLWG